jgi:hypothetical protein
MEKERRMPSKRPREPIAPTTIPGEPLDPKIPTDEEPELDEHEESEEEQQARDSEKAFDQALTRTPPG